MVHVAPMSHGSGSKILAYFMRGARNITLPKFDPATFLARLRHLGRDEHVRRAHHDPDVARRARTRIAATSAIRNITYGGAPMPGALAEEAIERVRAGLDPGLRVVRGTAPRDHALARRTTSPTATATSARPGIPRSGVEVRIVGDDGHDVPEGEPGELWIRGRQPDVGLLGRPGGDEQGASPTAGTGAATSRRSTTRATSPSSDASGTC